MDPNLKACQEFIENGQCVLFLGPRFAMDKDGTRIHLRLKEYFTKQQEEKEKQGTQDKADKLDMRFDNLFIFSDPSPKFTTKIKFIQNLNDFYKTIEPHDIYDKIAQMPFQAVVSSSPDLFLKHAIEKGNYDVDFQYFSNKINNDSTEQRPLLYNLYGNITQGDSLISTFDDFYTFVSSLLAEEQKIPSQLRFILAKAKVLLFFGFDLSMWYIPLILRKLKRYADPQQAGEISAFVTNEIKYDKEEIKLHFYKLEMVFLDEETIPVLNHLHTLLKDSNTLRKPKAVAIPSDEVKDLIVKDKIREAIKLLTTTFQKLKLDANDIIAIAARFTKLTVDEALSAISPENAKIERAQITRALLVFADLMDNG